MKRNVNNLFNFLTFYGSKDKNKGKSLRTYIVILNHIKNRNLPTLSRPAIPPKPADSPKTASTILILLVSNSVGIMFSNMEENIPETKISYYVSYI